MSILNRRNAILGWSVWQLSKVFAKRKAKQAVPGTAEGSRRPNKGAIFTALAAAGGAIWFWRHHWSDGDPTGAEKAEPPKGDKGKAGS